MSLKGFIGTCKLYSPQICLCVSIVTSIASVVTAIIATPKALEIVDDHKENLEVIQKAKEDKVTRAGKEYSEDDYKKDNLSETLRFAGKIGLTYLPSALLLGGSIGAGLAGFKIMSGRVAALNATCTTLAAALEGYRQKEAAQAKLIEEVKEDIKSTADDKSVKKADVIDMAIRRLDSSVDPDNPLLSPYAIKIPASNTQFQRLKGDPVMLSHWLFTCHEYIEKKFYRCAAGDQKLTMIDVLDAFDITPMTDTEHVINWDFARANGWMNCKQYYDIMDPNKELKDYTGDDYISCGFDGDSDSIYRCLTAVHDNGHEEYYLDFNCFGNILTKKPIPYTKEELYEYWEDHPIVMK